MSLDQHPLDILPRRATFEHQADLGVAFDVFHFLGAGSTANIDVIAQAKVTKRHTVRIPMPPNGREDNPSRFRIQKCFDFLVGHTCWHLLLSPYPLRTTRTTRMEDTPVRISIQHRHATVKELHSGLQQAYRRGDVCRGLAPLLLKSTYL